MTTLLEIDEEGRVSVPQEIREAAGLKVGDKVAFSVERPGKIILELSFPTMSIDELREKFGAGEPIGDWNTFIAEAEAEQADELLRRIREGNE